MVGIATSCEDDDPEYVDTVTFEDAAVSADTGYFYNRAYVYQGFLRFVNNYAQYDGGDYFKGWGVSTKTDTVTPGAANQASIFGTGGAGGSKTFAFGYAYPDYPASVSLVDANAARVAAFTPRSVKVALTTYVALALRDGNDGNGGAFGNVKLNKGGWFSATFVGYNGDVKTGSVVCYPGDWRGESLQLMTAWTPVDLQGLGEVTRIDVEIGGSEELWGPSGFNAPTYVAIDDLEFVRSTR